MNLAIAEKIISDALNADPRTQNLQVSRNKNMVTLYEAASDNALGQQTQQDVNEGLALPGTLIHDMVDKLWEGTILETRRTKYVVERTASRSGRGGSGQRFVIPFERCILR